MAEARSAQSATDRVERRRGVALIVVNYQSARHVARLLRQVGDGVDEVIVVDNASAESVDEALDARPGTRLVKLDRNLGYGAAANRGAQIASTDVLVVCNPDVHVDGHTLSMLAEEARQPGVGLASPRFTYPDGSLQVSLHKREPGLLLTLYEMYYPLLALEQKLQLGRHPTYYPAAAHQQSVKPQHVLGALMAVRTEAFDAVGGFDEAFFLYREETDLCRRLRDAGWDIRYVPEAEVVHEGGGSTEDTANAQGRPAYLDSHYRYIAKHRGRVVAAMARAIGLLASTAWLITGPRRAVAWRAVAWHLGRER